ncbi:MAG TPA: hypothetical protein PLW83_04090, partial [Deltaproteobacteria bacterium]|nr:hypothetical protein [Deltaproteobacteria bacterium]
MILKRHLDVKKPQHRETRPMKDTIEHLLKETLASLAGQGSLPPLDLDRSRLEVPPSKDLGDYATNVAMVSAKLAKMPPMKIAAEVARALSARR